jgi:hypothetical protein
VSRKGRDSRTAFAKLSGRANEAHDRPDSRTTEFAQMLGSLAADMAQAEGKWNGNHEHVEEDPVRHSDLGKHGGGWHEFVDV